MNSTRTTATLPISQAAFNEIAAALLEAAPERLAYPPSNGYSPLRIDLDGLSVVPCEVVIPDTGNPISENSSAINCTKNQKPKLSLFQDGGRWCVLYGDDLQDGISGFGMTPDEAITQFSAEVIRLQEYLPDGSMLELLRDTARIRAQKNGEVQSNNDEVICPACATQFRAIPVNVQSMLKNAGYAPPFMSPDRGNVPEVDGLTFAEMKANSDRYLLLRDGDWRETPLEPFIRLQLNLLWDSKIDAMLRGESLGTPAKPAVPPVTPVTYGTPSYTPKYLHDLTCMHAGAPWDTPALTALGEILAIHDMLRDNGESPVDPATLSPRRPLDSRASLANTKTKPEGPANVTIDTKDLSKPTAKPSVEASKGPVVADTDAGFDRADIAAAMGFLTGIECYGSSNAVGNLLTAYEELQRKMLALKDLINT